MHSPDITVRISQSRTREAEGNGRKPQRKPQREKRGERSQKERGHKRKEVTKGKRSEEFNYLPGAI